MLAHEELDEADVLLGPAEPPADRDGEARADLAVRAAVGLADVVEQRPERERDAVLDLLERLRRHREVVGVIAARERVQAAHGVERVLVDRVHVIDVVLHAARRRLPLGHERREHAEVLHLLEARRVGRVARVAEQVDEARARVDVRAQRLGARGGELADELARAQREAAG